MLATYAREGYELIERYDVSCAIMANEQIAVHVANTSYSSSSPQVRCAGVGVVSHFLMGRRQAVCESETRKRMVLAEAARETLGEALTQREKELRDALTKIQTLEDAAKSNISMLTSERDKNERLINLMRLVEIDINLVKAAIGTERYNHLVSLGKKGE